jgi:hypothetical protein
MSENKTYLPHQQRVIEERDELKVRSDKLGEFLIGNIYQSLPSIEKSALYHQLNLQVELLHILNGRISRF